MSKEDTMDRDVPVQNVQLAGDVAEPPPPKPLDVLAVLAVLEAALDPKTTPVERATLLAKVRAERERMKPAESR